MKKDIHSQYYPNAKVECACGNTFTVGAVKEKIEIEICSACHPFFTGKEKLVDTAGRVEKFKARQVKQHEIGVSQTKMPPQKLNPTQTKKAAAKKSKTRA